MLTVRHARRVGAVAALVVGTAVLAVLLLSPTGGYIIHAHFIDASQLVKGARVEVGGRQVGSVSDIRLADDGQADVVLDLGASEVRPLHRGTVAAVRAVGLSGVANRFVDLTPGPPAGDPIPNGGVLTAQETRPIVDLDAVLNAFDPATRRRLQGFFAGGADIFAGGTAPVANQALDQLDPAIAQGHALADELSADTAAVGRLVSTGAEVAQTLAAHGQQVEGGLSSAARTLQAVAAQRRALADGLARAPAVLRQSDVTLDAVDAALVQIRPALRELRPVAAPLAAVLRRLAPTATEAVPVLRQLNALLPAARKAAAWLPALDAAARPALVSTTSAVRHSLPTFQGLRLYGPDVLHGSLIGIGGPTAASYDATGHFARYSSLTAVRGVENSRKGNLRRCPGGASEPAPDNSNPWVALPSLCDPSQDVNAP